MAFNPTQYVIAPSLQSYFVDKLTGEPLDGGQVYFYKDNDRTEFKDIYQLTGTYGSYSYVALPNPITLSSVGTIQDDDGNDIIPYYHPYADNGEIELYYVVVKASDGTPQWTREAWPNTSGQNSPDSGNESLNYIPNGQFLSHTDLPNTGLINNANSETILAQGGWTFNRPADGGSTAIDNVTFVRDSEYSNSPSASPRYKIKIVSSASSSDTYKDLRIKFRDVNKFASPDQIYQFSFWAEAVSAFNVGIYIIKNYGTGSSASTSQSFGTITIPTNGEQFSSSLVFGTISGVTVSELNDDNVQIAIRFPTGQAFSVELTDFVLEQGEVPVTEFPQTPDSDFLSHGVAGWMPTPAYDGSDLYLPLVLTREGLTFDNSQIGRIYSTVNAVSTTSNEILCDGNAYVTANYSDLGVPYSRLQTKLWNSTFKFPIYGTGDDYLSTYAATSLDTKLIINTNKISTGTIAAPSNGVPSPAFTYYSYYLAVNNDYGISTYLQSADTILAIGNDIGSATAASDSGSNSGVVIAQLLNTALLKQSFTVQITNIANLANPGSAGRYFTFSKTGGTNYYVWFHFTNETDPAPGGTAIKVDLGASGTSLTVAEVANIVASAMNNKQSVAVNCAALATADASCYFKINTQDASYIVWFSINGAGIAPSISGTKIKVTLSGATNTAQVVALAIQAAMNGYQFAVPDFRGMFLRGVNGDSSNDPNAATRFGQVYSIFGNRIGTFENYQIQSHLHTYNVLGGTGGQTFDAGGFVYDVGNTGLTGGNETRPINANINYVIIY